MRIALPLQTLTHPLLSDLAAGMGRVFSPDELLGFYLGGSLALGGFDPDTSDLDFLVVSHDAMSEQQFEELHRLHAQIRRASTNRLYRQYEGVYLSAAQAAHPAAGVYAPHLGSDGHFAVEEQGYELLIDLWKVRMGGFVVLGAPPDELIGAISTEQMLAAKVGLFRQWWLPKLERREPMGSGYQVYAVLTMARILYGVCRQDEVSKRNAAEWLAGANPQFAALLRAALNWREGDAFEKQEQVYALMSFVRDHIEQAGPSQGQPISH